MAWSGGTPQLNIVLVPEREELLWWVFPCSDGVGDTNKVGDGSYCCCDFSVSMLCFACLRGLRVEGLRPLGIEPFNAQKVPMFIQSKCNSPI